MSPETSPCPLCGNPETEEFAHSRGTRYFSCDTCGLIHMGKEWRISPEREKARYEEHNNSPGDPRYVEYLTRFYESTVKPWISPGDRVLDFGSGPEPVFSALLRKWGYQVWSYDPFFAPGTGWKERTYQAVTVIEVAEHLFRPAEVFSEWHDILAPGGFLFLRTELHYGDRDRFLSWWYRIDNTHVSFYGPGTFHWAADTFGFTVERIMNNREIVLKKKSAG